MSRSLLPLALALGLSACLSPTIPVPPPSVEVAVTSAGLVRVEGTAMAHAWVSCVNLRTQRGAIVQADGSGAFVLELEGRSGDELELWQSVGTEPGEHAFVTVP